MPPKSRRPVLVAGLVLLLVAGLVLLLAVGAWWLGRFMSGPRDDVSRAHDTEALSKTEPQATVALKNPPPVADTLPATAPKMLASRIATAQMMPRTAHSKKLGAATRQTPLEIEKGHVVWTGTSAALMADASVRGRYLQV